MPSSISDLRPLFFVYHSAFRIPNSAFRCYGAIMHNKYNRNPEKLRAWKSATHLERAPERKKKDAEGGTSPTP